MKSENMIIVIKFVVRMYYIKHESKPVIRNLKNNFNQTFFFCTEFEPYNNIFL